MTLVDTCVLLDVVQDDPRWADWSQQQLAHAAAHGGIVINPVIFAEFSVWYGTLEQVDAVLDAWDAKFLHLPREALFVAGKAFRQYRARGGTRSSVLPDFFIGAHAAFSELLLLTRAAARYRSYFPTVALVAPGVDEQRG